MSEAVNVEIKSRGKTIEPKKQSRVKGKIARIGLSALALGGTGVGVYEAYQNVPAIHQSIDSLKGSVSEHWKSLTGQENIVPTTFENKVGKTSFGENNVVEITPEEAQSKNLLEPKIQVDNTGTVTVTTLLPGIFSANIPDTQIKTENHPLEPNATSFVEKHFIMPEGYRLTIPKGTHYALLKANPGTNQDPNLIYAIVTFFYDPLNNISFHLTYESTGFIPGDGQEIFDRETYNRLYNPGMGGKSDDLPIGDGTTPVAKPASPNQTLDMALFVKTGQIEPNASLAEAVSKSVNATWKNVVDSNQKLIVTSSK